MKISCQVCGAKYAIADEKVRGKSVKVKCKKCGTAIVVGAPEASALAAPTGELEAYAPPAGEGEWLVNVADSDQRPATLERIVEWHRAGVINNETFIWKDGMPDWLPVEQVTEVVAALGTSSADDVSDDAIPTRVANAPPLDLLRGSNAGPPRTSGVGAPRAASAAPRSTPPAARTSSAPAARASAALAARSNGTATAASPGIAESRTGARNDNSVLFSLAAVRGVTASSAAAPASTRSDALAGPADSEASGLIDMRTLAASLNKPPPKRIDDRVDDIMNLGGAPLFGPALSSPLLAPPVEPPPPPMPTSAPVTGAVERTTAAAPFIAVETPTPRGGGKGRVLLGVAAFVVLAGGAFLFARGGGGTETTEKTTPASSADADAKPTAPAATSAPVDVPAVAKVDAPSNPDAPATDAPANAPTDRRDDKSDPKRRDDRASRDRPRSDKADVPAAPAPAPAPVAAPPKAEAKSEPAPAPAAAAAEGTAFDRGAAMSALSGPANAAGGCKAPGGPTGSGRVTVTFAPNGTVSSVAVDPPFGGTPVGNCIMGRFRGARVPAFSGGPQPVKKSFTIN